MSDTPSLDEQFVGCLLGLAVGDALGSHFEGQSSEWIQTRYASPAALRQNPPEAPWHYTDDTQMAIGVAEALLKDQAILEETLCTAFVENYSPSRGYGRGARVVLQAMEDGEDYRHWANELFPGGSFGNGAAMRVAPVGLLFHRQPEVLWEQARLSSLPTHVHPLGIEGAQLLALAIAAVLEERSIDRVQLLEKLEASATSSEFQDRLKQAREVDSQADLLRLGNGIAALDSVVTAITCFCLWPNSFEQVVCNAILLGGDTDTIAAMAGALAGAHLGVTSIPTPFLDCLEDDQKGRSYLAQLASQLAERM